MATITTTTVLDSLVYPSESLIDRRNSDSGLYFLKRTSSTQVELFRSTDNGASWSNLSSSITRTNLQETSGIFIDADGHLHLLYRVYESGADKVYYRRRNASSGSWETERLIVSATAGSAGAVYTGMAIVAFKQSSTYYIFAAIGQKNGTNSGVVLCASTINSAGTWALNNALITNNRDWLNAPDGIIHPSLDFRHTGNGKSPETGAALWLCWGRTTLYCVKLPWVSGPSWFGPFATVTIASGLTAQDYSMGRQNGYGDKFNVAYPNGSAVSVSERNIDNSGGSTRTTGAHPQGTVRYLTLSNSATNNNYRVFAVGTTTDDLYYNDFTASSNTWGGWNLVSGTDIVGTVPNNFTARRNNYGNGQYDLVIAGGTTPYTLTHTSSTAASAPNTPSITAPENGAAKDVNQSLTISWTFTDDDPLDSQLSYALKRVIGASTTYWNNGTTTWQGSEVFNTSGTSSKTFSSGWGSDSDAPHNYSVKVKDQAGLASPAYSSAVQVIPSAQANPTLTSPGASVTTPTLTASWTVASQSAYRAILESASVVIYDSGWVSSAATSIVLPTNLQDGVSYTFKLTTRNTEGLDSTQISQAFTVSLTPPPVPTSVTLTPNSEEGGIYVTIDNAVPSGGQPDFASQDIYRRNVGDTSNGVRIASAIAEDATFFDFTVASGVDYEYRVLVRGVNQTTIYSSWIS